MIPLEEIVDHIVKETLKEDGSMSKRIDIYQAVRLFYALQALKLKISMASNFNLFYRSHEKLWEDINKFQAKFEQNLATAIHDYTVLVVAGEMRHAKRHCTRYYTDFYTQSADREHVYQACLKFNPKDLLRAGEYIYSRSWDNGYGGDKWALIAKGGLMYYTSTPMLFIDHMVDISHNNSIYFDKGANIMDYYAPESYLRFLNKKKFGDLDEILIYGLSKTYQNFINRANVLFGLDIKLPWFDTSVVDQIVINYQPLEWGNQPFNFTTGWGNGECEDRDEREYEDEDR